MKTKKCPACGRENPEILSVCKYCKSKFPSINDKTIQNDELSKKKCTFFHRLVEMVNSLKRYFTDKKEEKQGGYSFLPDALLPEEQKFSLFPSGEGNGEWEQIMKWTFPGLRFYYRDTDRDIDIDGIYKVGSIIRAGFFVDVSLKAGKPAKKVRYVVASAHAALMYIFPDFMDKESVRWQWSILHYNSYFKVLDVYRKDGVTQVLLLHIPFRAISLFRQERFVDWVTEAMRGIHFDLVEVARKDLDAKLQTDVCWATEEKEWVKKTETAIGCNTEIGELFSLEYINEEISISQTIRERGRDMDELNYPDNNALAIVKNIFDKNGFTYEQSGNALSTLIAGQHSNFKTGLFCEGNLLFVFSQLSVPVPSEHAPSVSLEVNRINNENPGITLVLKEKDKEIMELGAYSSNTLDAEPTMEELQRMIVGPANVLDAHFFSLICAIIGVETGEELKQRMLSSLAPGEKLKEGENNFRIADPYNEVLERSGSVSSRRFKGRLLTFISSIIEKRISPEVAKELLISQTEYNDILQRAYNVADAEERDVMRKLVYLVNEKQKPGNEADDTIGRLEGLSMTENNIRNLLKEMK